MLEAKEGPQTGVGGLQTPPRSRAASSRASPCTLGAHVRTIRRGNERRQPPLPPAATLTTLRAISSSSGPPRTSWRIPGCARHFQALETQSSPKLITYHWQHLSFLLPQSLEVASMPWSSGPSAASGAERRDGERKEEEVPGNGCPGWRALPCPALAWVGCGGPAEMALQSVSRMRVVSAAGGQPRLGGCTQQGAAPLTSQAKGWGPSSSDGEDTLWMLLPQKKRGRKQAPWSSLPWPRSDSHLARTCQCPNATWRDYRNRLEGC